MSLPHTRVLALLAGDGFSAPGYNELERALFAAVDSGALPIAVVAVRDETAAGGFRTIDPAAHTEIRNGWVSDGQGGRAYVRFLLEPAPFRAWLKSTGRWPLPPGHALTEWLGNPKTSPHVSTRRDTLEELLLEIEQRASSAGIPYERCRHPGNSKQFQAFILQWDDALFRDLPDGERFTDELHAVGVRFLGGNQKAKGDKFYRALFPEVQ